MKFKKLIIQGFKSFVDKTVIDFPDGITCIVGPNGSGKSNILDAIRWILGEQNPKELRGSDMDDIIFAGSERRSQSNVVSVTLVISDIGEELAGKWGSFSEIEITRKYYRDGEREYFINNKRCKLKDIREIFFDTGLGARSISIIEQGKVEKIISASPEEIRLFFDEAAGITKFKEKKKEAEKRLEQAKENLSRVKDIISEVKEKFDTLKVQVEKLKLYNDLKEKRDFLEKTLYSINYKSLIDQYQDALKRNDEIQIKLSSIIYDYEDLKAKEISLKDNLSELEKNLRKKNDEILYITEKIGEINSSISVLVNNIQSAENAKLQMNEELKSITNRLKDLSNLRDNSIKTVEDIQIVLDEKRSEISEIESVIEDFISQMEDYQEELDINRQKFLDITEKISNIRNELIKLDAEKNRLDKDISRLENEKLSINSELEKAEQLIADLKIKKDMYTNEMQIIKESFLKEKDELNIIEAEAKEFLEKLNGLKISKSTKEQQIKILEKELKKQSYGDELFRIFEEKDLSLLLDYDIDENVKNYLGDVVVFTNLSKNEVFLKITSIKTPLKFIFQDEVESLKEIFKKVVFRKIDENIVQIDGIYYKSGDVDRAHQILALKSEINTVKEELQNIILQITDIEDYISKIIVRRDEKRTLIENFERQLREIEKTIANIDIHIKNNNGIRDNLIKREITVKKEIQFSIEELKRIDEKNSENLKMLEDLSSLQKDLEEEHDEIKNRLDYYEDKIEESKDQLSDLKIEYSTNLEKLNSAKKDLVHIEKEITVATNKMHHLKDRLAKLMSVDIQNWELSLKTNREKLEEFEKRKFILSEEKRFIENEIYSKNSELELMTRSIEEKNRDIKKIEQELQNIKIRVAQIKTSIENLENRYFEKYTIILKDDYTNYLREVSNLNELKSDLLQIENKINEIGPLNMAADQEYLEIEERFNFLVKQKEDIEKAIQQILNIINEIDSKTIETFKETFFEVRKHFKNIFQILFGDGKAEITLTNEGDILNTGVEIFVQPPGKRLQNMTLLSGGEKAMTACVLLFAMFLYKPSPFCFLDEIDAPLDDANIGRFAKIVQELSQKAQFVIITHNQKTMEAAEYLYGVTMQEPGVSKIVSVKLDK